MKFSRITAAALIAVTALSQTASAAEFEDTKGHWAEAIISDLADRGIVNGVSDTRFDPEGTTTRAEFLRMVMMAFDIPTAEYRVGEALDTPKDAWYSGYIQGALDRGILPKAMIEDYSVKIETNGDETKARYSGKFKPESPISREEIAVLTQTAYQYWTDIYTMQGTDVSSEIDFKDLANVSYWALPYVRLAYAQGFINGLGDGNFRPRAMATRAQAAAIISKVLNKINKINKIK